MFILGSCAFWLVSFFVVTFEFRYCRTSEDICAILPSLGVVMDALSVAKSWLKMSEPFLVSNLSLSCASSSLLKVEALEVRIIFCMLYVSLH